MTNHFVTRRYKAGFYCRVRLKTAGKLITTCDGNELETSETNLIIFHRIIVKVLATYVFWVHMMLTILEIEKL
jgi:hypothetical protein